MPSKIFDNKLVLKSFIILFAVTIPFNIIHETGHAIPCYLEGKEFDMNIGLLGSSLECKGNVDNKTAFRASGGLLAFIVSMVPFLIIRKTLDKYPYINIVFFSMAAGQLTNMGIESLLYNDYISNGFLSMILINVIQYASFIFFVYHYSKLGNKK